MADKNDKKDKSLADMWEGREGITITGKNARKATAKGTAYDEAMKGDHIAIQGDDGKQIIIPRRDLNDAKWNELVEKAKRNPDTAWIESGDTRMYVQTGPNDQFDELSPNDKKIKRQEIYDLKKLKESDEYAKTQPLFVNNPNGTRVQLKMRGTQAEQDAIDRQQGYDPKTGGSGGGILSRVLSMVGGATPSEGQDLSNKLAGYGPEGEKVPNFNKVAEGAAGAVGDAAQSVAQGANRDAMSNNIENNLRGDIRSDMRADIRGDVRGAAADAANAVGDFAGKVVDKSFPLSLARDVVTGRTSLPGDVLGAVTGKNDLLGGLGTIAGNVVDDAKQALGIGYGEGQAPATTAAQAGQQTQPVDPALAGAGGGGRVGTSDSEKLKFSPGVNVGLQGYGDLEQDMRNQAALQGAYGLNAANIQSDMHKQAVANREDAIKTGMASDARILAAQNKTKEVVAQHQATIDRVQQEVDALGRSTIDTGRFWANKDSGQKVAALIAGACFGFTGQGMQWLGHLKSLVDQDIDAQKSDFDRQERALGRKQEGAWRALDLARSLGADDVNAEHAAKAALLQYAGMQAQNIADTAQSGIVQQNALMAKAGIQSKLDEELMAAREKKNAQAIALGHLQLQSMELGMKQAALENKAAGGAGAKLPPTEQARLDKADAGLKMLDELERVVGSGEPLEAAWDQVAKQFGWTDANNRDIMAKMLNRSIFAGIDASVVNHNDQIFLNELQTTPGLAALHKKGSIAAYRRMLMSTRESILQNAKGLGQNVSGVPAAPPQSVGFTNTGGQ